MGVGDSRNKQSLAWARYGMQACTVVINAGCSPAVFFLQMHLLVMHHHACANWKNEANSSPQHARVQSNQEEGGVFYIGRADICTKPPSRRLRSEENQKKPPNPHGTKENRDTLHYKLSWSTAALNMVLLIASAYVIGAK